MGIVVKTVEFGEGSPQRVITVTLDTEKGEAYCDSGCEDSPGHTYFRAGLPPRCLALDRRGNTTAERNGFVEDAEHFPACTHE